MPEGCNKCNSRAPARKTTSLSIWSTLLIVLLPKCPLCVMAYSSALTICGGESIYMQSNNWLSFFPIALALVIVGLIARNYRGGRTLVALGLAGLGSVAILLVHQLILPPLFYDLSAALLFLAIWLNGSMFSFVSTFVKVRTR